MKTIDYTWNHPTLAAYKKKIGQGEALFEQGQPGTSMFIILSGIAQLFLKEKEAELPVTYIESGSFLGEQILVSEERFWRSFTARAATQLEFIELDTRAIEKIQKTFPNLIVDILKATFQVSLDRLNKANHLLHMLRSNHTTNRFIHLLVHLAQTQGRICPEGREVIITPKTIQYYIDMTVAEIERDLWMLLEKKSIVKKGEGVFVIRNEKALLDQLTHLVKELPPLKAA